MWCTCSTDCDTYGLGPIGSFLDGCGDDFAEGTVNILFVVLLVCVFRRSKPGRAVPAAIGAILAMSSTYHILFGEMTLAGYVSYDKPVSQWLLTVNTRDRTTPATIGLLLISHQLWSCCANTRCACLPACFLTLYGLVALAIPRAAEWAPGPASGVFLLFDLVGVAIGVLLSLSHLHLIKPAATTKPKPVVSSPLPPPPYTPTSTPEPPSSSAGSLKEPPCH